MSRYLVRERVRAVDPTTNQVWRGRATQYVDEPALLIQVGNDVVMVPASWAQVEHGDEVLTQVGGVNQHTLWNDKKIKGRVIRVTGFERVWVWRTIDGRRQRVQSNSEYAVIYNVVLSAGGKTPTGRRAVETYSTHINDFIKRFTEKTDD